MQLLVVVLLIAYKEGKRPDKAFELFRDRQQKGLERDLISCSAAIGAYRTLAMVQEPGAP